MNKNIENKFNEKQTLKGTIKAGLKEGFKDLNEENKKEVKKAWLTKRISEIGEETLLYPKVNAKRHPYTKEVVLIAGTQGYTQESICELCDVSQSQVSLWGRGENQATIVQLAPLIAKLSPKVPGNAFSHKTIVSQTYIELPDDWEKAMLLNAYSTVEDSEPVQSFINKTPQLKDIETEGDNYYLDQYEGCPISEKAPSNSYGYNNTRYLMATLKNKDRFTNNFENIEKSVLGNLKVSHRKAISDISDNLEKQIEEKELLIKNIKEMNEACESELSGNEAAISENEQQRKLYLLDNSELNELTENKLKEFLNKHFPIPEKKEKDTNKYKEGLQHLIQKYQLKSGSSISEVVDAVKQDVSDIEKYFNSAKKELEESYNKELLEKTILGKYNNKAEQRIITFKKDTKIDDCLLISELAYELYSNSKHTLTIPITREIKGFSGTYDEFVASESGTVTIELSMADIFVNYCKTLNIRTDFEDVQICGEPLLTIKNKNLNDSDSDSDSEPEIEYAADVFECYQLFNQGLLLSHCYESDGDNLSYIYSADNAEELIKEMKECMVRHHWSTSYQTTCLESLKVKLIENGYRLPSIRSIY